MNGLLTRRLSSLTVLMLCRFVVAFLFGFGLGLGIFFLATDFFSLPDNVSVVWGILLWVILLLSSALLAALLALLPLLVGDYRAYLHQLRASQRILGTAVYRWRLLGVIFCFASDNFVPADDPSRRLIHRLLGIHGLPATEVIRRTLLTLSVLACVLLSFVAAPYTLAVFPLFYLLMLWGELSVAFRGKNWLTRENQTLMSR